MADSSKTEKPTAQRIRKAREQGDFVTSRVMVAGIQFTVFVAIVQKIVAGWGDQFRSSMTMLLERAMNGTISSTEWPTLLGGVAANTLLPVFESLSIVCLASIAAHLAISRLAFSFSRLTPKFDRLNPFGRLRELPMQNAMAVLQAVCLLVVMTVVLKTFYEVEAPALFQLPFESVPAGSRQIGEALQALLWKAAGVFLLLGAIDLFREQRKYNDRLRMSKQDVKDENKRNEGDPQIKGRIRRLRRDLLRRQMMREVPKATAVVVNPVHFAVAIRYDSDTMACPVVVAKGKNWLALRIRQLAVENEVPVIENPPLARALYEAIEVGRTISPEFYKAIAEILAYVYRMMGRNLQR